MIGSVSFASGSALPGLRMASSTGPAAPAPHEQAAAASFSSVLQDYMNAAAQTVKQGESAAIAGIEGTMPVQMMVERVLAAERTLQAAIAVRDKLVSSYLEISRMQI